MSDLEEKQYRFLEVGELIEEGDEWIPDKNTGLWRKSLWRKVHPPIRQKKHGNKYRRLIPESKPNEETNIPDSTDRRETSTDSSSDQPNRDRHITIDKSNYCWDGSVDLTKQHCISVSVEEV